MANWCPADVSALTSNSRPCARHGAAMRSRTRRARVNMYARRVRIASARRRRVRARMRPSHVASRVIHFPRAIRRRVHVAVANEVARRHVRTRRIIAGAHRVPGGGYWALDVASAVEIAVCWVRRERRLARGWVVVGVVFRGVLGGGGDAGATTATTVASVVGLSAGFRA